MMDAPRMRSVLASKWISHLQATKHRERSSEQSRCSVQCAQLLSVLLGVVL